MQQIMRQSKPIIRKKAGMEMVQVAILIALAIVLGLIFRTQITNFVNGVFSDLSKSGV